MSIVWLAFITGLTTGGISCLAVQGGLLAAATSTKKGVSVFILAKLISYTLLGFLLGFLGSMLLLTPRVLGIVQILTGLFMLATALRIANVHPIFRYAVFTPPRWTYRFLKNSGGPATLGFFTVLMPCGVTQATMAVAVASGNPWMGAAIMFAFVLGTSPVFFLLGATVVELLQRKSFSVVAASIVAIFAVLSINGGVGLMGSPYTLQNYWKAATNQYGTNALAPMQNGVQQITIDVRGNGYTASAQTIQKSVPVRLIMQTHGTLGCSRAFTIPELGISKVLPLSGMDTIEFTPTKTGVLVYTCSMGMYSGTFNVI